MQAVPIMSTNIETDMMTVTVEAVLMMTIIAATVPMMMIIAATVPMMMITVVTVPMMMITVVTVPMMINRIMMVMAHQAVVTINKTRRQTAIMTIGGITTKITANGRQVMETASLMTSRRTVTTISTAISLPV